jgi:hypothetical protein
MRRLLVCSLLLVGGALAAPAWLALSERPARALAALRRPLDDARACKPQAPVQASLALLATQGDELELALSVASLADAGALRWALELPAGATLLQGADAGALAAGQSTGTLHVRVRLAGDAGERVQLRVEGQQGPGGALAVRRTLTWGTPAHGGRDTLADVGSARERLARAPVRHRGSAR